MTTKKCLTIQEISLAVGFLFWQPLKNHFCCAIFSRGGGSFSIFFLATLAEKKDSLVLLRKNGDEKALAIRLGFLLDECPPVAHSWTASPIKCTPCRSYYPKNSLFDIIILGKFRRSDATSSPNFFFFQRHFLGVFWSKSHDVGLEIEWEMSSWSLCILQSNNLCYRWATGVLQGVSALFFTP